MEIGKYVQFVLTKPPWFNTRKFLNLRVLKQVDSKICVFKPRRFLIHGDQVLSKKIKNSNFKNAIEVSKLNLLKKKPIACHYVHGSLISCKKINWKSWYFFFNHHFLYMEIQTCLVNNSAKLQQMRKIV